MIIKLFIIFLLVQQNSAFIRNLKDLVDSVSKKIEEEWEDLTEKVKDIVADIEEFAKATIDTLKSIKQDLLANLKNLKALTDEQFKGLRNRLKDFTFENLKSFLHHVNKDVLKKNWQLISELDLLKTQKRLFANASFDVYGHHVKNWTSQHIKSLKKLLPGIPTEKFKEFSKNALSSSLDAFCNVGLSAHQKVTYLASLTSVFGDVKDWKKKNLEDLCDSIEALTPEEILKISSEEISEFFGKHDIKKFKFSKSQQEAILKKLKESWGNAKTFSLDKFKRLQNAVSTIPIKDIKELDKDKLLQMVEISAADTWDAIQANTYLKQAINKISAEGTWSEEFIAKSMPILSRLNNITRINLNNLMKSLNEGSFSNWTLTQARYILSKDEAMSSWSTSDIVKRAQLFEGMLQSDYAKIGGAVLMAAFPELVLLRVLAPPAYRFFVKVWKDNDGDINKLHQFANALTRQEISERNIADILKAVETLANVDFDEAQLASLMYRLKKDLGDLNMTDSQTDDKLPWGYQNLKKIGKVVLAFTKDEIRNFPLRDIVYSVEVMGEQDGWKRKMVLAMTRRLFDYWQQQNKSLADLTEMDIEMMGKFVQGLTLSDLEKLSQPAKLAALQQLGKYTGLPEDKLQARATYFYNHLKNKEGGITSNDLRMMQNLMNGLSAQEIRAIPKDVIMENLKDIMTNMKENNQGLREVFEIYKENIGEGDLSKWTTDNIRDVMETLKTLKGEELYKLSEETFKDVVEKLSDIEEWSRSQKQAIINKMKEIYGQDISTWSGDLMDKLSKIMDGLSDNDILKLTADNFKDMSRSLYDRYINADTKEKLSKRFKTVMGKSIDKLSTIDMKRFEGLLGGFDLDDVRDIKIGDVDVLAVFGQVKNWSKEKLDVVKEKAKDFLTSSGNIDDYLSVGDILKGFTSQDIDNLSKEVFLHAAGSFGKVKDLDKTQLKSLAKKAKESWGNDVSNWNDDKIAEAKNIIGGLSKQDIPLIKLSAIPLLQPEVFQYMDDEQIQSFTVDQFEELSVEQANSISVSAKASMSEPQVAALKSVEDEDPHETKDTSAFSGSVSLSGFQHFVFASFMGVLVWML